MLVLPNNDLWIFEEETGNDDELYTLSTKQRGKGLQVVSPQEFLRILYCKNRDDKDECVCKDGPHEWSLARKWTKEFGGYWDCNFDVFEEVHKAFSVNIITTKLFTAYEMQWGEIVIIEGGQCSRFIRYPDREAYNKAITFEQPQCTRK